MATWPAEHVEPVLSDCEILGGSCTPLLLQSTLCLCSTKVRVSQARNCYWAHSELANIGVIRYNNLQRCIAKVLSWAFQALELLAIWARRTKRMMHCVLLDKEARTQYNGIAWHVLWLFVPLRIPMPPRKRHRPAQYDHQHHVNNFG
jgi:hypothetical protein